MTTVVKELMARSWNLTTAQRAPLQGTARSVRGGERPSVWTDLCHSTHRRFGYKAAGSAGPKVKGDPPRGVAGQLKGAELTLASHLIDPEVVLARALPPPRCRLSASSGDNSSLGFRCCSFDSARHPTLPCPSVVEPMQRKLLRLCDREMRSLTDEQVADHCIARWGLDQAQGDA